MREDLLLLYKETLEREDKITMAHSIEMREPYLDTDVIRVALAMDIKLNVRDVNDGFGKHVHRKAAVKLGIPYEIAYRVKEAAQHGSGIHDVIKSIANENGYNESSVPDHYLKIISRRERIGSFKDMDTNMETIIFGYLSHMFRCTLIALQINNFFIVANKNNNHQYYSAT